jgi:hypothetical protein
MSELQTCDLRKPFGANILVAVTVATVMAAVLAIVAVAAAMAAVAMVAVAAVVAVAVWTSSVWIWLVHCPPIPPVGGIYMRSNKVSTLRFT